MIIGRKVKVKLNKKQIYLKVFSPIEGLQQEERIGYFLVKQDDENSNLYGLELESINSREESSHVIEYLSEDKQKVLNFIKYLYENSIKTDVCKDIIDDFSGRKLYY